MFDSGVSASDLIENLKSEIDVSSAISNATYVSWLNTLEQMLYSEIIKEQVAGDTVYGMPIPVPPINGVVVRRQLDNLIDISRFSLAGSGAALVFEDLVAIYADGRELMKTDKLGISIFKDSYCKVGTQIQFDSLTPKYEEKAIYNIRPALKTVNSSDVIQTGNVMLPYEHLDLVRAKLRGEAYKLANVFDIAANWINDYNALLEVFKTWVLSRK